MSARRARPSLRCLREDLELSLPTIDQPLDELRHPLLDKASEQFASPDTPHERIAAIDDTVLFKVKVQRWRGAVWTEQTIPWLVAAGRREAGSPDDFYALLAADGKAARARYNAEHRPALTSHTYTAHLLPEQDDWLRYRLEAAARLVRDLAGIVRDLARASLRDGYEHQAGLDTFTLGVQIRADDGHETYVAIRIRGSVPDNLVKVILDLVPGCDHAGWYPEAVMPDRHLVANEQAWSNIMNTEAAAKLLDDG